MRGIKVSFNAILDGSGQRTCTQYKLEAAVISVEIMQLRV